MCGIYGVLVPEGQAAGGAHRAGALDALGRALRHRGPDGHAVRFSGIEGRGGGGAGVALGVERLRIVDLDPRADQPFASPDGGVLLACNGEIYNAGSLRARYRDYPFVSRSDVETILPLYLDRGVAGLAELDGMFALAIWDGGRRRLILGRDRAGEKPLFYIDRGIDRSERQELWWASEVQALLALPPACGVRRDLDPVALDQYQALGYVLSPRTLFAGIRQVEAGTFLSIAADAGLRPVGEEVYRYWDPLGDPLARPATPSADPVGDLRTLLEAAVAKQVVADVPLGVFTSGGLDSSILAALASRVLGPGRVHTFAARFTAPSYDESPRAAEVARLLGTRHREVICDEPALLEAWETLSGRLAEPLADPALLPVYLLARAARPEVQVILSGEGADELFGGYPTYLGHHLAPRFLALPRPVQRGFAAIVARLPASGRKVTLEFLLKRFLADVGKPWGERHLAWFGTGLTRDPAVWRRAGLDALLAEAGADPAAALLFDYRTYLRDNLLVKVDRATMLASVEARAPFLDRDLTAFALALPIGLKIRGWQVKRVLQQAAQAWLPRAVVRRPKRGLSVPVAEWLNGGLRPEVDRLLAPERLKSRGILDAAHIGRLLAEHRAGQANHARPLWAAVVLERFLERWVDG